MSGSTAHEIGIVHYPGAQVACILGLTDLFAVASTIALDQRRSGQSPLRVTHWKPIHCDAANLSCVYDSAPRGSPKPRTLIIPPTIAKLPDPDIPPCTVHAPQSAIPHPNFVPLRPRRSRIAHNKGMSRSTPSKTRSCPFTVSFIACSILCISRPHRLTLPGRAGRTNLPIECGRDRKKNLRFTTVRTRTSTSFAQEHRRNLPAPRSPSPDPASRTCIFDLSAGRPIRRSRRRITEYSEAIVAGNRDWRLD